jgi:hypothetical protein
MEFDRQPRQPDISYKVGDDAEGFSRFITELRRLVTEHPRCKDLMADHPELSSTPNHPVLRNGRRITRRIKPERLFHIKLEAGEGVKTSSITLFMRDDNLDVIGFINKNGHCYELADGQTSTVSQQLPSEYEPKFLRWGLDCRNWVLDTTRLGNNFAADAVRVLSSFPDVADGDNPRLALLGLSVMVCNSARMNPVHDAIARGWKHGTTVLTKQLMDNRRSYWLEISAALLDWRDHAYQGWPQNGELEKIGIRSPEDALKVVPLVFNDEDRIYPPTPY